jgi:two-component system OmpR family response regulator
MLDCLDLASTPLAIPPPDRESMVVAEQARSVAMFVGSPSEMAGAEDVARRAGFAAVRVGDAASAEVMLSHRPADLIVLDGGQIDFGACRRLASLRVGSVLVVTDTEDEVDRVLALELGADDCVSPSCGDRELAARMRALARRAPRSADGSHILRFLDFRLDLLKLDLRRLDGGRVPLSRSELELLHLFLNNSGRVLSPDDIRAACKGEQWLNSRNVAVRVSRLRRRLRAESGQDPIRTVHAQGYIFDAPVVPA